MPRLRNAARRMLRDPQDSDDALQEGLLLAFRKLGQFQGRSSFSTWLHSIVRNAALTHLRKKKCRPACSVEEELFDGNAFERGQIFVDPGPGPEEESWQREKSRILSEVVQELPSRYGFAMRLYYADGVDLKDAAQAFGISTCAFKTHLFRARRLAVRRMRERCSLPEPIQSDDQVSNSQQTQEPGSLLTEPCARGVTHSKRKRSSAPSKRRRKLDFVGGSHATKGEKSPFWKCSLANHIRAAVPGTRRQAS